MTTDNKDETWSAPENAQSENQTLGNDAFLGRRVKLKRDVERFPHFIARSGTTGIINWIDDDNASVKMDAFIAGCEEWDNCILWDAINKGENMWEDVELTTDKFAGR